MPAVGIIHIFKDGDPLAVEQESVSFHPGGRARKELVDDYGDTDYTEMHQPANLKFDLLAKAGVDQQDVSGWHGVTMIIHYEETAERWVMRNAFTKSCDAVKAGVGRIAVEMSGSKAEKMT
ncbi:MAG: phage tail tube protein [Deltaproteobacteria bacterium]|nr:phage tail tube protein [Deltaproteobacteria bacterium]